MIWFFLAGWIAGAVAVFLYLNWWAKKHIIGFYEIKEKEEEDGESKSD